MLGNPNIGELVLGALQSLAQATTTLDGTRKKLDSQTLSGPQLGPARGGPELGAKGTGLSICTVWRLVLFSQMIP